MEVESSEEIQRMGHKRSNAQEKYYYINRTVQWIQEQNAEREGAIQEQVEEYDYAITPPTPCVSSCSSEPMTEIVDENEYLLEECKQNTRTGNNLKGFSQCYRDRTCVGGLISLRNHPNYISLRRLRLLWRQRQSLKEKLQTMHSSLSESQAKEARRFCDAFKNLESIGNWSTKNESRSTYEETEFIQKEKYEDDNDGSNTMYKH